MDIDSAIKLGLLAVAIIGIPKLVWESKALKKSQLRE